MMAKLKIGILGAGRIGSMHAELLATQVTNTTVTGVFDVATAAAQAVGEAVTAKVYDSAAELIASPDVDAVAIASSTDTHVDLLVEAATAGKPIFCEKPISLDLNKVDDALAAVEAAGVPLQIGFNRRFDPSHAAVRRAVVDGTVGRLRQVRITSRDPEPPPIPYIEVSGGIFCDMTIHDFDMARFVTGSEVVEVYARGAVTVDQAIGDAGDLDTVVVLLTHADGTLTTIDNCRQSSYGYDQRVEVFGSAGMASSANHLDHSMMARTKAGGLTAPVQHFFLDRYIPSYIAQWNAFVSAVADDGPVPVHGADGRAPLVIGLAAWQSIREHRPIPIDHDD